MTGPIAPPPHREPVRDDWIDYNGHLSEAYYVLIFSHATDALMVHIGMDDAYRERTGCSLYTVQAQVRYLREVAPNTTAEVVTRIVGVDAKRVRLCHEMTVAGTLVATEEVLGVHVDQHLGRACPFQEDIRARFERLVETPPEYAGGAIAMPSAAGPPG